MQVKTSELRRACDLIFAHLDQSGHAEVDISKDFYWNVPEDAKYDRYETPSDLDVGQLTEDWDRIQGILGGATPPIGYALVWLGSILRAVGEEVVQ